MRSLLFVVICSVFYIGAVTGTHKSKPGGCKKKQCGRDEQYYDHKPDCKNTCENHDNPAVLCAIGEPGCFCKEGLVKRKDGKCVRPRECPQKEKCKKDEQYYEFVPSCKNTCENHDNPGVRCAAGPPGCFCKEGLVKRKDGKCVNPEDCNKTRCGKDEQYYECTPSCKNTCRNYDKLYVKCACAPPGCFCKEGFVKRDDGKCVKPERCPQNETGGGGSNHPTHGPGTSPPIQCDIPNCDEGCTIDYKTKPCPSCDCKKKKGSKKKPTHGPATRPPKHHCSMPKCEKGCRINYKTEPCPTCDCKNKPPGGKKPTHGTRPPKHHCSMPKCEKGCRLNYKTEPCPTCDCKHKPPGGKKPTHGTRPPKPQCSMPKCEKGCTINYKTEPCPSCDCKHKPPGGKKPTHGTRPPKHHCSMPKCEKGCRINYKTEPCPTCDCKNKPPGGKKPTHSTRPPKQCSIPKCDEGCTINYKSKPCPTCDCKNKPKKHCGKNEVYKSCGSACPPTCKNNGKPGPCTRQCVAGCFCKNGLVKNDDGKCVKLRECKKGNNCPAVHCKPGCWLDKKAKPCPRCVCDHGGHGSCGKDEVYKKCGSACPPTCKNHGKPVKCTKQCVPGCFCKGKMVRNDEGKCVNPKDCKKGNNCPAIDCKPGCWLDEKAKPCPRCVCDHGGHGSCGKDEVYKKCGSACPPTCKNHGKPVKCTKQCVPGCFCKGKMVRNNEGKCVNPKDCKKGNNCPAIDCKPGCRLDRKAKPCPRCVCDHGGHGSCGKDEVYKKCGSACPPTCKNHGKPVKCTKQCVPGCFCKGKMVRNDEGKCVNSKDCKKGNNCPAIDCKRGCWLDKEAKPCPRCVCDHGVHGSCGKDEVYKKCGSACPPTCKNHGKPVKCTKQCVPGCFCKGRMVRNDEGKCVNPKDCKKGGNCPIVDCKPGCWLDEEAKPCPRCVCDHGGHGSCGKDEVYKKCGSACPPTCKNHGKPVRCTRQCVPGCFCKGKMVRNDKGKCVNPKDCKKGSGCPLINCKRGCWLDENAKPCPRCVCDHGGHGSCGSGEVYKKCGSACPPTCKNHGKPVKCTRQCVPGCFCKAGTVRNDNGKCVNPKDCKKEHECPAIDCLPECWLDEEAKPCPRCVCDDNGGGQKCGKNEQYSTCVNPCNDCEIRGKCNFLVCNKGCDCIKGYHRDSKGKCIPASKCPPKGGKKCGKNEQYVDCVVPCNTCELRGKCDIFPCNKGCDCRKGYYRNDKGACIPERQCPGNGHNPLTDKPPVQCSPPKCPRDCKIDYSSKPCPSCKCHDSEGHTCPKKKHCKPGCRLDRKAKPCPRCVCDDDNGYERCRRDEQYYQCTPSCKNTCRNYNNPGVRCACGPPGCFCKKGLVKREKDGKCVKPDQCEKRICPQIRCKSGCELDEDAKPCPRCVCDDDNGGGQHPPTDEPPVQCDPPKCPRGCRIDYTTKPCPSCECDDSQEICGKDEQYYQCTPSCKNTCRNYNNPGVRCACGPPGCFCKKGLVKREKDGKCVKPDQCEKRTCPQIRCKPGCELDEDAKPCPRCVCDDDNGGGHHPPTDGPPVQCDPPKCPKKRGCRIDYTTKPCPSCKCDDSQENCGKDEQYYLCTPSCKNTCKNYNNPGVRCVCGPPGCFCKKGLVKRETDGKCVKPNQCKSPPGDKCGKNERFTDCVIPCNDCETRGDCEFLACNEGCDCKEGYYRDENQKCIPASQCPGGEQCGLNEHYEFCGTACPETCDGKPEVCTLQCVQGCFCDEGYVRNDIGLCVPRESCDQGNTCGKNERYTDCVIPCNDCETRGDCEFLVCNEGCDCKEGYYRDENQKCIPASQCPSNGGTYPTECPKYKCKAGCHLDDSKPCPKCACPDDGGTYPTECPKYKCKAGCHLDDSKPCPKCACPDDGGSIYDCKKDEEFYDCIPSCQNTCETYGKPNIFCAQVCREGCFCKKGLVKRKDGKCVKPSQCKSGSTPHCKRDEQFYDCIPTCNVCESYGKKNKFCSTLCRPGCFCKQGLLKRKDGKCVKPSQCKSGTKPTKGPICHLPNCPYGCHFDESKPCPKCICPGDGSNCGVNEEIVSCAKPKTCNTCAIRGNCLQKRCIEGCDCKPGYYRDEAGICIPESECPEDCGVNEEVVPCAKPKWCNTCDIRGNCKLTGCTSGCDCKSGYYRGEDGVCIPADQCPNEHEECEEGEEYQSCGNTCERTCSNYRFRIGIRCPTPCRPGCFCKDGLVRAPDGKCVETEDCGENSCGQNEVYKQCGSSCPPTCSNPDIICIESCVAGCFCEDGYIRSDEGQCIPVDQCPPREQCGLNEQYESCGTACPETCEGKPDVCTEQCVQGCFCVEGYVRNDDGLCVPRESCNQEQCGQNEHYESCGTACPQTCGANPDSCTDECVQGCFCDEGYVRKSRNGLCVPRESCNQEQCGANEQYEFCGTACPETCDGKPGICTKQCVQGCFCVEGYVRNDQGLCVPRESCNQEQCGPNEQFETCGTPCPETCKKKPTFCSTHCVRGCFCVDGYVRNDQGVCIPREFCNEGGETPPTRAPTCFEPLCREGCHFDNSKPCPKCICADDEQCGPNEQYSSCGTACPETCYGKPEVCTAQCVEGCFCVEGYVRGRDGTCVPREFCNEGNCGPNEEYQECGSHCPPTCSQRNRICILSCKSGCFCKEGYIRSDDGICIPIELCPTEPPVNTCDKPDEQYYECLPCTNHTCETYNANIFCKQPCRPGCFCREGLVKRKDGKCVDPSQCSEEPPNECNPDEQYYECIPSCKRMCSTYFKEDYFCNQLCVPGCFCREGLVQRDDDGRCVEPEDCPAQTTEPTSHCKRNEQYYECIPDCHNTCETYGRDDIVCTAECRRGCFCKKGLVKRKDGQCVKPSQCPGGTYPTKKPDCPKYKCKAGCHMDDSKPCPKCACPDDEGAKKKCSKDEEYYDCMPACRHTCATYDAPDVYCSKRCIPGCFCKKGLVVTKDGKCVKPQECSASCKPDEQYYRCIPNCKNRCHPRKNCPKICIRGCYCKESLVQNDDGKCVKPDECKSSSPTKGPPPTYGPPPTDEPITDEPVVTIEPPPTGQCGKNEEYSDCGTHCPPTCEQPEPGPCNKKCARGCFCKKGYLRADDGTCVKPKNCRQSQCGKNEEYSDCGTHCPPTCKQPEPRACNKKCARGCFCKKGYLRADDGTCVKPKNCKQNCKLDEQYYDCIPSCKNRCHPRKFCPRICIRGCYCKEGLVQDDDGKCVRPEQCQSASPTKGPLPTDEPITDEPVFTIWPPTTEKCKKNEVYDSCGNGCGEESCDSLRWPFRIGIVCPKPCRAGCFCKGGYVRGPDNECIKPDSCQNPPDEKGCKPDEQYYECMPDCENRCHPKGACPFICRQGCFCKEGLVQDDDGRCVRREECQEAPPTDSPGEHCDKPGERYYGCVRTCNNTCENYNDKHQACPLYCRSGCDCEEGLVRRKDGACVSPEQCGGTKTCGKHEEYQQCGTACPPTCENPHPRGCSKRCVRGCFCKKGYLRNYNNVCVKKNRCYTDKKGRSADDDDSWSSEWSNSSTDSSSSASSWSSSQSESSSWSSRSEYSYGDDYDDSYRGTDDDDWMGGHHHEDGGDDHYSWEDDSSADDGAQWSSERSWSWESGEADDGTNRGQPETGWPTSWGNGGESGTWAKSWEQDSADDSTQQSGGDTSWPKSWEQDSADDSTQQSGGGGSWAKFWEQDSADDSTQQSGGGGSWAKFWEQDSADDSMRQSGGSGSWGKSWEQDSADDSTQQSGGGGSWAKFWEKDSADDSMRQSGGSGSWGKSWEQDSADDSMRQSGGSGSWSKSWEQDSADDSMQQSGGSGSWGKSWEQDSADDSMKQSGGGGAWAYSSTWTQSSGGDSADDGSSMRGGDRGWQQHGSDGSETSDDSRDWNESWESGGADDSHGGRSSSSWGESWESDSADDGAGDGHSLMETGDDSWMTHEESSADDSQDGHSGFSWEERTQQGEGYQEEHSSSHDEMSSEHSGGEESFDDSHESWSHSG